MPKWLNDCIGDSFYGKAFPEMKQTTQRRLQQKKRCVFSFFHFKRAVTDPELTVSEAPSKTATGHGEWCLFMTHFYLPSGGREKWEWKRESSVVTREDLCEDTRQCRAVVKKTRHEWNLLEMGHLEADIGSCRPVWSTHGHLYEAAAEV